MCIVSDIQASLIALVSWKITSKLVRGERLVDFTACQYCGEEDDTALHYLSEGPAFGASRIAVFAYLTLEELEFLHRSQGTNGQTLEVKPKGLLYGCF